MSTVHKFHFTDPARSDAAIPAAATPPVRRASGPTARQHPDGHADRHVPNGPRWARPMFVRLPAMGVVLVATWAAVPGLLMAVTGTSDPFDNAHPLTTLLIGLPGAIVMLALYTGLVRWLEGRTVTELQPSTAAGGLARGALVGLTMFLTVIGVLAALGHFRVTGTGPASSVATALGLMSFAAVAEELIFRGVIFRLVESRLGTWVALAVSAVLFGAMHLIGNPNATVWAACAIALEAGVMFAAAYAATRKLWVPIGIHFAWNFIGSLFGGSVAGSSVGIPPSLLTSVYDGPAALTGGSFGPEAGVPTLLLGFGIGVVFLVVAARRGNLQPAAVRRTTISTVSASASR